MDTLVILLGYNSKLNRVFEYFIILLVSSVAICLFVLVSQSRPNTLAVLQGFLPSAGIVTNSAELLLSIGIIGTTEWTDLNLL